MAQKIRWKTSGHIMEFHSKGHKNAGFCPWVAIYAGAVIKNMAVEKMNFLADVGDGLSDYRTKKFSNLKNAIKYCENFIEKSYAAEKKREELRKKKSAEKSCKTKAMAKVLEKLTAKEIETLGISINQE